MYQGHFGLKNSLFDGGIAQEQAVFIGPRQQLVVANFKVALTTLDSAIVLTGAPGVGKTTIASAALRTTTTRLALGWLSGGPANGAELLELLLAEFGFSPHRIGRVERLQIWRQFLNEMNATNSRVFVIAEHADEMEADVLRTLEAVTAADPNGCPGANLVLLGQAEPHDRLNLPALASLKQRIRLRQRLEPFTVEELEAYLKHRVDLAGGNFDQVFERSAAATLHQYSGGIPRVVNNLCETALTLAATGAEQHLTSQLVMRVAVGLYGIKPAEAPVAGPAPAAVIGPVVASIVETSTPTVRDLPVLTDAIDAPFEPNPTAHAPIEAPPPTPAIAAAAATERSADDADLDILSAALASGGWSDTDADDSALMETPKEKHASFGANSESSRSRSPRRRARKVARTR